MSTEIKFTFYVKVDAPAGFSTDEVSVLREYSTDDEEHACELAFRDWDGIKPENYIEGTLSIV